MKEKVNPSKQNSTKKKKETVQFKLNVLLEEKDEITEIEDATQ